MPLCDVTVLVAEAYVADVVERDITVLVAGALVDDMVTRDVTVLIDEPSGRHASARPLGRAVNASDVTGVIVRVPFRGSE